MHDNMIEQVEDMLKKVVTDNWEKWKEWTDGLPEDLKASVISGASSYLMLHCAQEQKALIESTKTLTLCTAVLSAGVLLASVVQVILVCYR